MAKKIIASKVDKQKLAVWLNYWLEVYAKPNVKSSTLKCYRSIIRNHIIPELGEVRLYCLNEKIIQKFICKKVAANENGIVLSQKTVKNILDVLYAVLRSASEGGIIRDLNFADAVLPDCKERDERYLSFEEQACLYEQIDLCENISAFAIILMLETGLKKYELLSLKWQDIDYDKQSIKLSDREVPLTASCYKKLMSYKEKQKVLMHEKSIFQNMNTYIIANSRFTCYTPEGYNKMIKRISSACGLTFVTATTLRNTFGANCLLSGGDLPTVSYIMGDSNIRVTRKRYDKLISNILTDKNDRNKIM